MRVHAAKNDLAAFELVVYCDQNYLVNIGRNEYFSQRGDIVKIRVAVECALPVRLSVLEMHLDDDGRERADALLSCDAKEYCAGETMSCYCEVEVPKSTQSGEYTGRVTLFQSCGLSDETVLTVLPFEIHVGNHTLKDPHEFRFYLDLWQHLSNIARKHETPLWSDDHFAVIEQYVKSLARLGQKAVTVVVSEIPWNGQNCHAQKDKGNLYEYSMIPVTKQTDGRFTCDFSIMQRYIDLCAKYGIDREISLYGLVNLWGEKACAVDYPDKVRIRYYDKADKAFRYMRKACEIDGYVKALEQYFLEHQLMEKVRLAADEPADVAAYRASIEHLLLVAPSFRLKAAINHAEFIPQFGKEIVDYVPALRCLSEEFDTIKRYQREMDGKRFLWYVCCQPEYPNTFLRSNLCESVFLGVLTSYLELDGFLRWNYTVWPDDPRRDIRYSAFQAGDTNFVYPSAHGTPLLTLRYYALRQAVVLFELLSALKARGETDALDEAYHFVVRQKDVREYFAPDGIQCRLPLNEICSLDPADYETLKAFLLERLSH